jgi:RHS repeat-associated protein
VRIKHNATPIIPIREAVQTRVNTNLSSPSWTSYYHLQDANFNDLGVVNATGTLVERYEYSAYGQRQVFTSAGSNDPGCYAPVFASRKVIISGISQAWGLNEIGHQGLLHDEQSGLVYNRARHLNPTLGRFMQNDPLGYVDGLNEYMAYGSNSVSELDPGGTCVCGADVTANLQKLVQSVQQQMERYWISGRAAEWREAYDSSESLNGWDIGLLAFHKDKLNQNGCGEGACANKVTVKGRCYRPEEVNYFFWGVISKATYEMAARKGYHPPHYRPGTPGVPGVYRPGQPAHRPEWLIEFYRRWGWYRFWADRYGKDGQDNPDWSSGTRARVLWYRAGWLNNLDLPAPTAIKACDPCNQSYIATLGDTDSHFQGHMGGETDKGNIYFDGNIFLAR